MIGEIPMKYGYKVANIAINTNHQLTIQISTSNLSNRPLPNQNIKCLHLIPL